jgi:hypothetical protein
MFLVVGCFQSFNTDALLKKFQILTENLTLNFLFDIFVEVSEVVGQRV